MYRLRVFEGFLLGCVLLLAGPVAAQQQSSCADCHFANPTAPARGHLEAWDRSAHSWNNVGCEKCHGGDAKTFESALAHRGILRSVDQAVGAGHEFVYDNLKERLATSRKRIEALLGQLANPK